MSHTEQKGAAPMESQSAAIAYQAETPYIVPVRRPSINGLFERFFAESDLIGTTEKSYKTELRNFKNWLQEHEIQAPSTEDVKAYKNHLQTAGYTARTQQSYISTLKRFFKWTASEGLYPDIAARLHNIKVNTNIHCKDALSREDVPIIAQSIDRSDEQGKRLYAMYLLCITCGLRTVEISRANIEDLKTVGGVLYLYIQGKGHTEKDAPMEIIDVVKDALKDYMDSRQDKYTGKSPLFVSTSNKRKPGVRIYKRVNGKKIFDRISDGRMEQTTISTLLKKMLINAGYDSNRLTAHSLRHTSGTGAYLATGNLFLAQKHQRHADPKTTEIYVHAEERAERHTEQQIYDYYFTDMKAASPKQRAAALLNGLDTEQLQKVIDFIEMIK